MATAKLNQLFSALSGTVGDLVIVPSRGKLVVRRRAARVIQPTPARLAHQARFREAAAYGRRVQSDPLLRQIYSAVALKKQLAPFHIAVADFLNAPEVLVIEAAPDGSQVRVGASDDFEVVQVEIRISSTAGPEIESGLANLDPSTGFWVYQIEAAVAPDETVIIKATAVDRPQHTGEKQIFWQRR